MCWGNKASTISGVDEKKQRELEENEGIQLDMGLPTLAAYKVDDSFGSVIFRLEAYVNGTLVKTQDWSYGNAFDKKGGASGFIATYFTGDGQELNSLMTISTGKQEIQTPMDNFFKGFDVRATTVAWFDADDESIEIEEGKEILVSAMRLDLPGKQHLQLPSLKEIAKDQAVLNDVPFVLLLKCKFTVDSEPTISSKEMLEPHEEIEVPIIPDDENVSLPDNG